jgi:chromosome partitioning protein
VVAELEGFITSARGKSMPWSDARIFQTRIRRNIKLAECPSFGQTILAYGATSNGASDYRALAKEVLQMAAATAGGPAVSLSVNTALDETKLKAANVAHSATPEVAA